MGEPHWVAAEDLAARIGADLGAHDSRAAPDDSARLVGRVWASRRRFGITRLASLTGLDRTGITVAQAVRPLSLANAVAQGKGVHPCQAAASALMESLESWAAERIAATRIRRARAIDLGDEVRDLYAGCRVHGFDAGWDRLRLGWVDGWDILGDRVLPVPTALVDTIYTYPSPHPVAFPRSTTGLAAGTSLLSAVAHAGLEVLERAGIAASERRDGIARPVDAAGAAGPAAREILRRLAAAGLVAGAWDVEAAHGLPLYRCHVMEGAAHHAIAPLPGEGFGCDFGHDRALAKALLEAAAARVTAVAGAREDITRASYPQRHDREQLEVWRRRLATPPASRLRTTDRAPGTPAAMLAELRAAFLRARAGAAIIVSLASEADPPVEVVRLVAPPLRDLGGARH